MKIKISNCQKCGRPLSNFNSVKQGIGPVCAQTESAQRKLPFEDHAKYEVVTATGGFLYLEDTGHKDNKTVTNDIAYILDDLKKKYQLKGRRIFYKDSNGEIDEIRVTNGNFSAFVRGHGSFSLDELYGRIKTGEKQARQKREKSNDLEYTR